MRDIYMVDYKLTLNRVGGEIQTGEMFPVKAVTRRLLRYEYASSNLFSQNITTEMY